MTEHGAFSQLISLGRSNLHIRRLGSGPPVVLLHESPRSAHALMPLARRLASRFTVFAVDTPGYGLSDPLDLQNPEIEDFADSIAGFLRKAGLERVPIYGTHTGATIAVAMGVRHADLVSGMVLDGYPIFSQHERDLHEACYLPQFPPSWDGSHIAALWSRVRDQFDYFPWYIRGNSSRLGPKGPSLTQFRKVFNDFLSSGPSYVEAYAASFRFDAGGWLAELAMPFHVIARDSDLLHDHLDRLPALPAHASKSSYATDATVWSGTVARHLQDMIGDTSPPDAQIFEPLYDGACRIIDRKIFVRFLGSTEAEKTTVMLHDLAGSSKLAEDAAKRMSDDTLVILPELPGCGISDPIDSDGTGLAELALLLEKAMDLAGRAESGIVGTGHSIALAEMLAAHSDRLTYVSTKAQQTAPFALRDNPLSPRWDGADLMAIWYELREKEIATAYSEGRLAGTNLVQMQDQFIANVLSQGGFSRWREMTRDTELMQK